MIQESPLPGGGADVRESIASFVRELEVMGRSRHTVRVYRGALDRLAGHLHGLGAHRLNQVELPLILDHLRHLEAGGASHQTLGLHQSAIRSWLEWLERSGTLIDPPNLRARPSAPRRLPRALTLEQTSTLLNAPPDDSWLGLRDRAILEVLYSTGCRLAELTSMDWPALSLGRGIATVLGKGKKERLVPLGRHAVAALKAYRDEPSPIRAIMQHRRAVWLSWRGRRMDDRSVERRVELWGQEARIEGVVTPHTLRHTLATHLLTAGAPLMVVKELLGHASVHTTQIYTHLVVDDLLASFDRHHPRAM